MDRDIRDSTLYKEVAALYENVRRPGTGQISDAVELNASPDGRCAVFTGAIMETLEDPPRSRICLTEIASGDTRVLTFGPNADRSPRFSPDGRHIAFLSDRHKPGDFQLYLLELHSGAAKSTAHVSGWVEYLQWSPDGKQILLAVAGHGADISGGQGAVTSEQAKSEVLPSWMPEVEKGSESFRWRSVWVYEVVEDRVRQVSRSTTNVWEASWLGNDALAAVVSGGPGEGLWYSARLHSIDLGTGEERELYAPENQLGWPAASPTGSRLVIVEALCSDRWLVAGDVRLIDARTGSIRQIDTHEVNVTYTEWRSNELLLLAGHRGFETVLGIYDARSGTFQETWTSREITTGGRFVAASGVGGSGDFALIGESFGRAPEIAVIRRGLYQTVRSFDVGYRQEATVIRSVECVTWAAPDGLEIQGWLLRPAGQGPYPLIMNVHGGPVWHWRPFWLGRGGAAMLLLLKRGYAVFFPNPRGSAGRGQSFIKEVLGDMGGADTHDHLSGLDHLVREGIADPQRLGVTGGSYGGFMSAWLITQDDRFAAAVPVAPVTNHVTEHLISNIPHFVALFLADTYTNPNGKYFQRSPIMHAHRVKTPTLSVCGALDRCTPPEEAVQFHNALLENGVKSVLVTYPNEGHGVRGWPASIDYATRVIQWFETHMSPT